MATTQNKLQLSLIIIVLIIISKYMYTINYNKMTSNEGHLQRSDNTKNCSAPASELRKRRGHNASVFLGSGRVSHIFEEMSITEAQMLIHGNMMTIQYQCKTITRYGRFSYGGYDVCMDDTFKPPKNCLVYSFGIKNEWSFDDAINAALGCEVHSFDPSMNKPDHKHKEPNMYFHNLGIWGSNIEYTWDKQKWNLKDLKTIMKMLKHEDRVIDYLKVDVEGAEWPLIAHLAQSGIHTQVKQIAFELHTPGLNVDNKNMTIIDYGEIYNGLKEFEKVGFRKFRYHTRSWCCERFVEFVAANITKGKALCCYNAFYVNSRFINK